MMTQTDARMDVRAQHAAPLPTHTAPLPIGSAPVHIETDPIQFSEPSRAEAAHAFLERDARLLVAGDYPAKGLTVTEADLDALVAHFSEPVPVKVEHLDSPLDPLGLVVKIWRSGAELLGRVKFPAEMAAFLASRNAHKLSIGLKKGPEWKLLEASLTRTPHVPTATLLSDGERAELNELRWQARRMTADAQLAELKSFGQVTPALEPLARALLMADDAQTVTLSDGQAESVSRTALRLLRALPPLVRFGEIAPQPPNLGEQTPRPPILGESETRYTISLSAGASAAAGLGEEPLWTDEEREILRRLGVAPEDVAREMGRK